MAGRDVYIVECVRTGIGKGRDVGSLHNVHPVNLLAHVLEEVVKRSGVPKSAVEDVISGVVTPVNEQGANVARLAALKAGFPVHVPGVQLNRMCGSGQQAVHFGAQAIASGDMDIVVACGVEMMGVVKMGSDAPPGMFDGKKSKLEFPFRLLHQGVSGELLAQKYGVSRKECDELSVASHTRAHSAIKNGYFASQIVPIQVKVTAGPAPAGAESKVATVDKVFSTDECVRFPTTMEQLSKLPPVFKKDGGVITAGNSSQVSDGAAAVLLCSGAKADELKLKKRARIVSRVVVGSDPEIMLDGVIPAARMALRKAGLTIDDMDVIEINEAFAPVVVAFAKELKADMKKVNPNGGAIAHGHPLGATGAILMTKLVNELERTGARYGLQTMCIGHGQATATIIERVGAASSSAPNIKSKL